MINADTTNNNHFSQIINNVYWLWSIIHIFQFARILVSIDSPTCKTRAQRYLQQLVLMTFDKNTFIPQLFILKIL